MQSTQMRAITGKYILLYLETNMGTVICCNKKPKNMLEKDEGLPTEGLTPTPAPVAVTPTAIASILRPKTSTFPVPDQYVSVHERAQNFVFGRKEIIDFLDKQKTDTEGFKEVLKTDTIGLWMKWGSQFEATHPLLKARYVFDEPLDVLDFNYLLQEGRRAWDGNVLFLEEIARVTSEVTVMHYALRPPMMFMSSKDFAEKRIRFVENGVYYCYSSSIPDEALPATSRHQRCENIFSGNILVKEESKYVYYTISQSDLKIANIPAALVTAFIPSCTKTFYQEFKKALAKRRATPQDASGSSTPAPINKDKAA